MDYLQFDCEVKKEEKNLNAKTIIILVFAFLVILFILQNTGLVLIKMLFWSLKMSRSLLVFWFFFMGIILGYLLFATKKKKKEN